MRNTLQRVWKNTVHQIWKILHGKVSSIKEDKSPFGKPKLTWIFVFHKLWSIFQTLLKSCAYFEIYVKHMLLKNCILIIKDFLKWKQKYIESQNPANSIISLILEEEVKWFSCKRCFNKLKVSWNKLELNLFKLSCVAAIQIHPSGRVCSNWFTFSNRGCT